MDSRLRECERKARMGDLEAAQQWLQEASRAGDYNAQYQALMMICELQHPGLMKQMEEMRQIMDAVRAVEPQPQVEEIWTTNNSADIRARISVSLDQHLSRGSSSTGSSVSFAS